jgi:hypothetical protein
MTTGTLWREEGWPYNAPVHPPLVTFRTHRLVGSSRCATGLLCGTGNRNNSLFSTILPAHDRSLTIRLQVSVAALRLLCDRRLARSQIGLKGRPRRMDGQRRTTSGGRDRSGDGGCDLTERPLAGCGQAGSGGGRMGWPARVGESETMG